MSANGKVVLVTGGSSGIGRATALAFARQGASVVIVSRGAERGEAARDELRRVNGAGEYIQADVSRVPTSLARYGLSSVASAASTSRSTAPRQSRLVRSRTRRRSTRTSSTRTWL